MSQRDCYCCSIYFVLILLLLSLGYGQENKTLEDLARLYTSQGKYAQAESLYLKTLQLKKQALGESDPSTLVTMNDLALVYESQGKYAKAEPLHLKTLELKKQVFGENHPETIISLNNLAKLYTSQGKYTQAEPLFIEILQLSEQTLGESHPSTLIYRNNLAVVYYSQGKYAKAEPLYLKTLQLKKQILGESHPETVVSMNNLAKLYASQGKYAQAEPLYIQALQLGKEVLGANHPDTLISLSDLALLYQSQGKYEKAQPLYLQALQLKKQVLGESHPQTLTTMNNLAGLYYAKGDYRKAESLYLRTLHLKTQVLGGKHPETLITLNNIALLYQVLGKYGQAEAIFAQILQLRKQTLGEKHPDTLGSLNNLAGLYEVQGKHAQAETLYRKALELRKQMFGANHSDTLIFMSNLADLYYSQEKYAKALLIMEELLQKKYLFLAREMQGTSEETRLKMLENFDVARDRDRLFSILESYPSANHNNIALYFLSNYKGILLRISQQLKQIFAGSENQQLLEELSQKRSEYSRLSFLSTEHHNNPSLVKKLEGEIEKIEKQLIWNNSHAKSLLSDAKPAEILQALGTEELLVDFIAYYSRRDSKQKLAAVVAKSNNIQIVPLGDLSAIQNLIEKYRKRLQQQQQIQDLAQQIYQKILAPLQENLLKKDKIYLVPDEVLHLLPFQSLLNDKGEYLALRQNFVILSSSQDLVQQKQEKSPQSAAIFAYPDYGKGKGKKTIAEKNIHFLPLPGTQEEAQAIAKTLDVPVKIYSENQATENNISQLTSPKILHIATHGYFLAASQQEKTPKGQRGVVFSKGNLVPAKIQPPSQENVVASAYKTSATKQLTNPLVYSGLALAGANHPKGDGILTALEVLGLHLHGTKLVVLSACETGVGEIRQGEGVYSLQRAFREAGAETVVASLWKVDDQATQIFMQKFYQRYMQGASAHKAARDTQLEFINSSRYSHPYYWSSFVVIGGRSDDLNSPTVTWKKGSSHAEKNSNVIVLSLILITIVGLISGGIIWQYRKSQKKIVQQRKARQAQRQRRKD